MESITRKSWRGEGPKNRSRASRMSGIPLQGCRSNVGPITAVERGDPRRFGVAVWCVAAPRAHRACAAPRVEYRIFGAESGLLSAFQGPKRHAYSVDQVVALVRPRI